jgi:two-component system sensor histidine kinase BaeS
MLVGLAYLDRPAVRRRLSQPGWSLTWIPVPPLFDVVQRRDDLLVQAVALPTVDGPQVGTEISCTRAEDQRIRTRTVLAVYATGALAALAAAVLGTVLALHWLRPLRRLAADCREQGRPLSDGGDLDETRALAAALRDLLATERRARDDLGAALERTRHLAAVHRAFLAGLAQEIGMPVARLGGLLRQALADGRLPPELLAEAVDLIDLLDARLGDAAALSSQTEAIARPRRVQLADWLGELADLLRPEARRLGVDLVVEAAGEASLPASRLIPVLIDLVANALRATPAGGRVVIAAQRDGGGVVVSVSDSGPGFAPEFANRVIAAFQRGEVLPGEPGFGLGLALAIDRVRRLDGQLHLDRTGPEGVRISLRVEEPVPPPVPR